MSEEESTGSFAGTAEEFIRRTLESDDLFVDRNVLMNEADRLRIERDTERIRLMQTGQAMHGYLVARHIIPEPIGFVDLDQPIIRWEPRKSLGPPVNIHIEHEIRIAPYDNPTCWYHDRWAGVKYYLPPGTYQAKALDHIGAYAQAISWKTFSFEVDGIRYDQAEQATNNVRPMIMTLPDGSGSASGGGFVASDQMMQIMQNDYPKAWGDLEWDPTIRL